MFDTKHEGMSEAELVRGFMESLTLREETQTAIERNARGQADNPLWFELRKGRITASKFHDVYTKVNSVVSNRSQTEPRTAPLVSKLIDRDENLDHLPAIKWGQEHENDALKSFYENEAVKPVDFKLEKCGLHINQTKPYIGASPDALLTCKCHGISPVEIKCTYTIRNESVIDSASQCDFLVKINDLVCLGNLGNLAPKDARKLSIKDDFIQELIELWTDLNYRDSFASQANFTAQQIWNNSMIRIADKTIFYKHWANADQRYHGK